MAIAQQTADFSRDIFNQLDKHWQGDDKGMHRSGYSPQETAAMDIVSEAARRELGMDCYEDHAGNRYLISPEAEGDFNPVRMAGSHLDAVPNGGRYDGPAGVVAPLAALYDLKLKGEKLHQPSCIVIWRNEESPWFGQFAVGSKLATGALSAEFIRTAKHKNDGRTLESHMSDIGLGAASSFQNNKKLLNPDLIAGLVETHIEQGSVLQGENKSLGVVTFIRGNVRFPEYITFEGETGHTGTVPQDERLDPMDAQALFITMCSDEFKCIKYTNRDIVWSYPQGCVVGGGSTTNIAKQFQLRPEVRTTDVSVIDEVQKIFEYIAFEVEKETGVKISLNKMNVQQPVKMSSDIRIDMMKAASNMGISAMKMPSGAGHDVQVAVQAGIAGGLIFIRHGNNGVSHRPDEIMGRDFKDNPFTTTSDFANAVAMNAAWFGGQNQNVQTRPKSFLADLIARGALAI